MKLTIKPKTKYYFASSKLPLAVYREVVAHLRQVDGVEAGLIFYPFSSSADRSQLKFDYDRSEIEALWLECDRELELSFQQRLIEILDYYGRRYHPWQSSAIQ